MANTASSWLVVWLVAAVCAHAGQPVLPAEDRAAGWQPLFDGRTTTGWRNYRRDELSAGWQAVDGALTRRGAGGDIVTEASFADFELRLEWRVARGGNSGIFFRVSESEPAIYMTAPEMQVLDDARHPDGRSPLTSAGSNFGLHGVPAGIAKPAGEWNAARLLVDGNHVEHWLNGERVVSYELGSEDWRARVAASKFSAWPFYGTVRSGPIGLQDHGDEVAFRNIRIRRLGDA